MSQSVAFKRGSSFSARASYTPAAGQPVDLSNVHVTSQVRTQAGALLATLVIAMDSDFMGFTVRAVAGTASWPVGVHAWDLKLEIDGAVAYTETIKVVVLQEVTA